MEGNAGTTNAVFTVTLSAADTRTVTVVATTADNTATSMLDYIPQATVVTFNPGETSKTVTVAVNGDALVEPNESFFVNLTAAVNATFGDTQGLGTIVNDDATPILTPPTLSINNVTVVEGNADVGGTSAVFTVTLSATSALPVTVLATAADGSATVAGVDFASVATLLTFLPGGPLSQTVTVAINGDVDATEVDETFVVDLTLPVNAILADAQGLGTILEDDTAPAPVFPLPTLSISDVAVLEGATATTTNAVFTITLSAASVLPVTVTATSADGTATVAGLDYLLSVTPLTFLPGETSKTVTVVVNGDAFVGPNETFVVDLTGEVNATLADAQGLGTIVNDDGPTPPVLPPPTLSITDAIVVEGDAGATNAVFTITLSAASAQTVTVVATPAENASATGGVDFAAGAVLPIVTFLPGETSKTVTIAVNGDVAVEGDETFVVNLSAAGNATLADTQGLATIIDDDPLTPPVLPTASVSISDVAVLEGTTGTTTNAVFTVTLSAASALPVTVTATTSVGTTDPATAGVDYVPVGTILIFLPGETSKSVTVVVNGDTAVEPNETFFVDLSVPVNVTLNDAQGLGTIINDDSTPILPPPTLTINDVTVLEENAGTTSAVFTVTLSAASLLPVTVTATSADGTATLAGLDYLLSVTPLTFLPGGALSQTVTVLVNGNALAELDETFFVNLTLPLNATLADTQGLGTILNDDPTAPVLPQPSISISDVAVLEGNAGSTLAVFTVTLSAASAQTVTVTATAADNGSATNPGDYIAVAVPTIVTFLPGETSKTVSVAVNGDFVVELNETFVVNLTLPINATVADSQGLGTIVNDDGPTPPVFPPADLDDQRCLGGGREYRHEQRRVHGHVVGSQREYGDRPGDDRRQHGHGPGRLRPGGDATDIRPRRDDPDRDGRGQR